MDFLQGVASPFEYLGKAAIIDPAKEVIAQGNPLNGNNKNEQRATQQSNEQLGLGQNGQNIGNALREFAGNSAQAIGDVVAPGAAKAIEEPIAGAVGGTAGKILGGATAGAAIGGAYGAAGAESGPQAASGKDLSMDFLKGAATGGVLGGGIPALKGLPGALNSAVPNDAGAIGNLKPSDQLGQENLQKLADTDNQKTVENMLKPVTGPVVAKELAPSIADQKDPEIIKNMVDQNLNNKLSSAQQPTTPDTTGVTQPSPALPPAQPITPVSDINTPQQVAEQGTNLQNSPTLPNESQPEPSFMNAPGETKPTQVGKLSATTGMRNILDQGGTVDEAMNHYMETTGGNYGEAQDQVSKLMNGDSGMSLDKGKVNASLNPQSEGIEKILPKVQEGDIHQPIKNAQAMNNEVIRRGQIASDAVKQLSPNDLALMDKLRGNTPQSLVDQAENPEAFLDAANKVKDYNDFSQAAGSGFAGQNVPYRQNYGAPILTDQSTDEAKQALQAKLQTNPGYAKGRNFNDYEDLAKEGIARKNNNFGEDLEEDIQRRASGLSQLTLAKGLNEALPGKVKVGEIGTDESGTYRQLNIPGGSKLSIPQEYANEINARAPVLDATGALGRYDRLNSNYKNIKLAGGGFHSLNVAGSYIAHQLASGNFLKDPSAISGMIKATLSDSAFKNEVNTWGDNGRLLDMDAAGLNHSGVSSQADIKPSGVPGKIPVLKQLHEAVFDRQIPYMKMKIFDQETQGLDRNNPDDLKQMQQVASGLNKSFGGLNRSFEGFTPRQFKVLSRVFLATDYNEGQLRTLGNAFTKGGAEGKLARQIVFGKALLWGGLATGAGAIGGEFNNQSPKQVALDILQKTVNPQFKFGSYTVGLPTTQLSELGKPISETVSNAVNGRSLQNPTKDFASARLAAIPSAIEQYNSNRNFSGNAIRGTDYYGRPVSPTTTLANLASMVSPIPVAQGVQTATGQQDIGASIANTLGVRATPTNNLAYAPLAGQTYVQRLQAAGLPKERIQADTQFFDNIDTVSYNRSKVLTQAETAVAAKDPQKAQSIIDSYNQKLIQALKPWAQSGGDQYLDSTMLQLLQGEMLKFKTASSNVAYETKVNPTSIGVPIGALASQPLTKKGGS